MSDIKARFKAAALAAAKPTPVLTEAFGLVYVRQMSAMEAQKLRKLPEEQRELHWLAASICSEDGRPIFDASNPDDVGILNEIGFRDQAPLLLAIYSGAGVGKEGEAAAAKN